LFDGQAEEAANFYISIFKNSRILNITHYGESAPMPKGTVLTVDFEIEGIKFIALNGGPKVKSTEAVSFMKHCDSQEEIDYYWEKLTAGGEESMCGWLKDKYGISWQIIPSNLGEHVFGEDPSGSQRAMQAMLKMRKLDIQTLKEAYQNG